MRILYKILPAPLWREARTRGRFEGSAADHRDGFIHLSTAAQMRETAARHFPGQEDLVLVGFREEDLAGLTWEPSRGGDLFPHVYGTIDPALAVSEDALLLENGLHRFPAGAA
ncbi:MAG: DUF952 domain-containing protein [Aestuariivirga sp.]|uniref:DUF952 domain-containing protein n=1 Tax=Aestuariivirga sp. TaxID=2650926 RepID=UPI0025C64641|nr:DUF952 domain-containing protein [Aestuariivirga sp.]MCA3561981.1 DUF952 domain-containing protein [Aestuariivirga sp.]